MRAALIGLVLAAAGCRTPPSAHIEARRLDGPRPPQVVAHCVVAGLAPPVTYKWRVPATVKPIGWSPPLDEPWLLVQIPEGAAPTGAWAECTAVGADKAGVRTARSLVPPQISSAPTKAKAGELVTVRGGGFGPTRETGDGLWLVPPRGAAVAADHACKGASWAEGVITACVPKTLAPGAWQLRVSAGGELAIAPVPLGVGR